MKQIYHKFTEWEDYKNGMYDSSSIRLEFVELSKKLLSNQDMFEEVSISMYRDWLKASQNHLTNKSSNRRSWIGQAACSYKFGATESETRKAWNELSNKIKINANLTAEKVIRKYEAEYYTLYKDLGEKMLF